MKKQTQDTKLFNPQSRLAAEMPGTGHLVLANYEANVPSMVGAIRVRQPHDPNAWERHDHGDEVLAVISGSCTATLRDAQGHTITRDITSGDVLVIPKGVAHSFKLHSDEVQVLFVTPETGTEEWTDNPT